MAIMLLIHRVTPIQRVAILPLLRLLPFAWRGKVEDFFQVCHPRCTRFLSHSCRLRRLTEDHFDTATRRNIRKEGAKEKKASRVNRKTPARFLFPPPLLGLPLPILRLLPLLVIAGVITGILPLLPLTRDEEEEESEKHIVAIKRVKRFLL